ncbi:uncharacterized protein LOC105845996 isoform X2 [Hydra vulgaris]|uniref:uncharacterized protein LOC105845996 isoform X2 n=1 Tax=Hydra vulgaris TaxID=6087 RepID=UPI001F5FA8D3|nr:uncharacterized protein LOC105845996 isoform X2 [Hydra vulgaris]
MADNEINISTSLKSIIEQSKYIDNNDNLLNAILKNGMKGLYQFQGEIAPSTFKCLVYSVEKHFTNSENCPVDDELSLSNSLKSIIKETNYIDDNDILLNAILVNGLNGLYEFQNEIAPNKFKHLELSVMEHLGIKNQGNADDKLVLRNSLKSIIKELRYIDDNDSLLNAILINGIEGLYEFQGEIAPKSFKYLEILVGEQLATKNKYTSYLFNQQKAKSDSVNLIIKHSGFNDTNGLLLNAILEESAIGLYKYKDDISPKIFKKIESSLNELISRNYQNNYNQDSKNNQSKFVNYQLQDIRQETFTDEIITKLDKQNKISTLMPDCFEKYISRLIYLIRLKLLPDNNITRSLKKQEEPINFDNYMSLYEKLSTEEINFNIEAKEHLTRALDLIKMNDFSSALQSLESLFKQIQPLDIKEIIYLIEKANETYKLIENRDVILLLGMTGSGKTATIHFLSGSKMIKQKIEIEPGKFLNHITAAEPFPDALSNFVISCHAESESRYINPIQINLKDLGAFTDKFIILCDSPGFGDTAGPEVDIANSISLVEGIRSCKSVRPVFLINYQNQGGRGEGIREMTRMIQDMVINIEEYLSTFSYLFTKYPENDIYASLLNIYRSIEKLSEPSDESFKAIFEDMLKKTKKNGLYLDLINHGPLDVLNKIINTPCIDDPKRVFRYTMTERSKSTLHKQAEYNKSAIICAAKNHNYNLIKYKILELKFLCDTLGLNELKQILKETIDFVCNHIERCYEDTKERLSRCLENQNKLSFDDLDYYVSQIEKFKDLHIFKDSEYLAKISCLSEALVQNLRLKSIEESNNFITLDIFYNEYSRTSLHNLKIITGKCDNQSYINACQFVIDQVNTIQSKLENVLEKNDFNASANPLQHSKIICIKFSDHENLVTQVISIYENLRTLVISKLKKLSESCEHLFAQQYLTDNDLSDINDFLQILQNAKHINLLCEHISKDEINKHCETFLSKIVLFFDNLNTEINHLFKNEKFKEMERVYKQMQLVRRIGIVEQRTAEMYYSTNQSITGYMKSLSDDTEKLLNNKNNDTVDYSKLFSNLKNLKDAEWLNKHKWGYYDSVIQDIQNNLTGWAFGLCETVIETNLDLELKKVDKTLQQLDNLKKCQDSVPDIQKYHDQSFKHFNNSVEKSLVSIKNTFCLEKYSLNNLKSRKNKMINILTEYQLMQANFLYLKSEHYDTLEQVDEKIISLTNNINGIEKNIEQHNLKQNWYNDILNKYSATLKGPKTDKGKKILMSYNFKSIEDLFNTDNENKKKLVT